LRGVAILLVVMSHAFYSNPESGFLARRAAELIEAGWMGVPIFFVLSGFLISLPYFQKRQNDPQFWDQRGYAWRRAGKILPPFYLSIVLFAAFFAWSEHDVGYWRSALIWASGLGNFTLTQPSFNEYYWSLLVEAQFYIVLPLLIWVLRGWNVERLAVGMFLILFLVPLAVRGLTWPTRVNSFAGSDREMAMLLKRFPTQLDYFGWGVLLAGIFTTVKPALEKLRALALLGYAGGALLVVGMFFWGAWERMFDMRAHPTFWSDELRHLLPAVAAFLMLFFIFDPRTFGARVLCAGWLRFTGIISFEWFLFHPPVCHWFLIHNGHSQGNLLAYAWKTLVPVAATFIFSALVYRYFSLPILNKIRDHVKRTAA
jgi:peptidoglycan/LPS O-acetylase OafA/YrhL